MYNPELINQKDSFTGYHTKQSLLAYLNYKFSGSLQNLGLTILIIDLDKFKEINDRYGHLIGDEALKHFVKILNKVLNGQHFVARYGGDEFIVVVDESDNKKVGSRDSPSFILAWQIVAKLKSTKLIFPKKSLTLRCSIGMASFPRDAKDHIALVDAADQALYYVKKHGRGGIALYNQLKFFSAKDVWVKIGEAVFGLFLLIVVGFIVYTSFDRIVYVSEKVTYHTRKFLSKYVFGKIFSLGDKKYDDYVILTNGLELNGKTLKEDNEGIIFTFDPWEKSWNPSRGFVNYRTLLEVPSSQIIYIHREVYPVSKHLLVVVELKGNRSIKGWLIKETPQGIYLSLEKIPEDFNASSGQIVSYMMPLRIPLTDIKSKFKL